MKKKSVSLLAAVVAVVLPVSGAHAQAMSEAGTQKLAENYFQADVNGDTALTRSEFHMLLRLNAEDNLGRASQIVRFGRQDMAFDRIDADRNGVVTQQELQALAR